MRNNDMIHDVNVQLFAGLSSSAQCFIAMYFVNFQSIKKPSERGLQKYGFL